MALTVTNLTGFGSGAIGPVSVLGDDNGVSTANGVSVYDFTLTIPSGGKSRAVFALVTVYDDSGTGVTSAVTLDPAGDNISLTESAGGVSQGRHTADVWSARIGSSVSGSLVVRVTCTENMNSAAITVVTCENVIDPTTPTFSGTDVISSGTSMTVSNVTCEAGGITLGCVIRDEDTGSFTWGSSLTERYDIQTGTGGQDHVHSSAYDEQPTGRSASTETVTLNDSDQASLVVASFR